MRRILLALVVILAGVLIAATAVYANDGPYEKYPPEFTVYKNGQLIQKPHYKGFKWTFWSRKELRWYTDAYTNPPDQTTWPAADSAKASQVITLRYMRPPEPTNVVIKSWRNREMTGEPYMVLFGWKPVMSGDKVVGWDILFKLRKPGRPHYVMAYVYWQHEEGTHHSYGWTKQLIHMHTYPRG